MLAQAAQAGDQAALDEIGHVAEAAAMALGNVVTLLHPERIALGGGVALMGDVLLKPLRSALSARIFAPFNDTVQFVACELEEDVVVVGALLLAGDLL
jgi:glucokinase